jgi:hypothetical protein
MKTITLTQPYATLVAVGAKRIETRSWSTRYRGPLAIHAGKGLGPVGGVRGMYDLVQQEPFSAPILRACGLPDNGLWRPDDLLHRLPYGAIVCLCLLVDVAPTNDVATWNISDEERAFGDYGPDRYGWFLANVRLVDPPIPARGRQGLWEWGGQQDVLSSTFEHIENSSRHARH